MSRRPRLYRCEPCGMRRQRCTWGGVTVCSINLQSMSAIYMNGPCDRCKHRGYIDCKPPLRKRPSVHIGHGGLLENAQLYSIPKPINAATSNSSLFERQPSSGSRPPDLPLIRSWPNPLHADRDIYSSALFGVTSHEPTEPRHQRHSQDQDTKDEQPVTTEPSKGKTSPSLLRDNASAPPDPCLSPAMDASGGKQTKAPLEVIGLDDSPMRPEKEYERLPRGDVGYDGPKDAHTDGSNPECRSPQNSHSLSDQQSREAKETNQAAGSTAKRRKAVKRNLKEEDAYGEPIRAKKVRKYEKDKPVPKAFVCFIGKYLSALGHNEKPINKCLHQWFPERSHLRTHLRDFHKIQGCEGKPFEDGDWLEEIYKIYKKAPEYEKLPVCTKDSFDFEPKLAWTIWEQSDLMQHEQRMRDKIRDFYVHMKTQPWIPPPRNSESTREATVMGSVDEPGNVDPGLEPLHSIEPTHGNALRLGVEHEKADASYISQLMQSHAEVITAGTGPADNNPAGSHNQNPTPKEYVVWVEAPFDDNGMAVIPEWFPLNPSELKPQRTRSPWPSFENWLRYEAFEHLGFDWSTWMIEASSIAGILYKMERADQRKERAIATVQ